MILISNIGNRDVIYKGAYLDRDNTRQKGEELLDKYDTEKEHFSYPIIEPFFETFKNRLRNIYIIVTNQEDERVRNSDTIHLGGIIKKWIKETYQVKVNVVQYTNNPTNYELVYNFFTSYFTQESNIFDKTDKRIISLSGGTPQMNGALYVILSSIYPANNEFYSVFWEKLIPINHEKTINKIFIKKSCLELLKTNQYQSLITILNEYNIEGQDRLILLLNYAKFRKNFDFDVAREHLNGFFKVLPSSEHQEYDFLVLNENITPIDLIKELFWNIEICHKNQNYLLLSALLFRLEEALLFEIVNYLFKEEIEVDLKKKQNHSIFMKHLKDKELDLWNSLQNITYKGFKLKIDPNELNRAVLFYIASLKSDELKKLFRNVSKKSDELKKYIKSIYQVGNILEIFDKINKYYYDSLKSDKEQLQKKYGNAETKCLGDLRNSSIIAHGFNPVSKENIEDMYREKLEIFIPNLKEYLITLLRILTNDNAISMDNVFDSINEKISSFILEL